MEFWTGKKPDRVTSVGSWRTRKLIVYSSSGVILISKCDGRNRVEISRVNYIRGYTWSNWGDLFAKGEGIGRVMAKERIKNKIQPGRLWGAVRLRYVEPRGCAYRRALITDSGSDTESCFGFPSARIEKWLNFNK